MYVIPKPKTADGLWVYVNTSTLDYKKAFVYFGSKASI